MSDHLQVTPSSTAFLGPQWAAKAEVLPPAINQKVRREAYQMVDPISRHGSGLDQLAIDALKEYIEARIAQRMRSFALGCYEPKVDDGWNTDPYVDERAAKFIDRMHARFSPKMRALADALVGAVETPAMPCPFEKAVDRHFPRDNPTDLLLRIAATILAA